MCYLYLFVLEVDTVLSSLKGVINVEKLSIRPRRSLQIYFELQSQEFLGKVKPESNSPLLQRCEVYES